MKKIPDIKERKFFTGCFLSENPTGGRLMAVNGQFLAMAWKDKGKIVIVNSLNPKYIQPDSPYFLRNNSNILDLEFSPFNNNILASGYSDKSVLLWKIPKEGLIRNIKYENTIYNKHNDKVNYINFNQVL